MDLLNLRFWYRFFSWSLISGVHEVSLICYIKIILLEKLTSNASKKVKSIAMKFVEKGTLRMFYHLYYQALSKKIDNSGYQK
uniref:Uncharacterized protein n=1 Tax=Lepeophtheirus salmonis TaxID=72036 RepID=A0A0K2TZ26_LEPSM